MGVRRRRNFKNTSVPLGKMDLLKDAKRAEQVQVTINRVKADIRVRPFHFAKHLLGGKELAAFCERLKNRFPLRGNPAIFFSEKRYDFVHNRSSYSFFN